MKKTIIFTLLGLLVGLAIGFVVTLAFFGETEATGMLMIQEKELFEMEEAAIEAYHDQPNEVAIWALENYINALNRLIEERGIAEVENPYMFLVPVESLAFDHTRVGLLYRKMGNVEKSKYHFEQAMLNIKKTNLKFIKTEEDLINFLKQIRPKSGKGEK